MGRFLVNIQTSWASLQSASLKHQELANGQIAINFPRDYTDSGNALTPDLVYKDSFSKLEKGCCYGL